MSGFIKLFCPIILLLVITGKVLSHVQLELTNNQQLSQGRHFYEDLRLKSGTPSYGACWTEAIEELHSGCKHLAEHVQQRLAFKFAECFLATSGRPQPECPDGSSINECLGKADSTMFSAYQTYFVHTQSICFYLKSELWQESTQNLITKLSATSHEVSKQLEVSTGLQKDILGMQSESVETQRHILHQGEEIGASITSSHQKALETFELYKQTTVEQKDTINMIFNRIVDLQSSVFGLFTGFNSFLFYVFAFLISYLVTSQNRTGAARFWMLISLAISLLLEYRFKPKPHEFHPTDGHSTTGLTPEVWTLYLRSIVSFLNAVILFIHYYKYKDYSYLNWQAHHNVERKVSLLFKQMEGLSFEIDSFVHGRRLAIESSKNFSDDESFDPTFQASSSAEDDDDDYEEDLELNSLEETNLLSTNEASTSESMVMSKIASSSFTPKLQETINLNDSGKSRYNLRTRRPSLNQSTPTLQDESPRKFAELVKKLANKRLAPRITSKSHAKQFSSDED